MMSKSGRFFLGLFFALALALCAFIPGMWVGAQSVGENQGLAGGAIVFITGLLIAGAAFVLGAILAYFLPARVLKLFSVILCIPATIIAVLIGYNYFSYRGEANAYLDEQITNLNPFRLSLTHTDANGRPFQQILFDTGQGSFAATMASGAICTGTIPATSRDKVDLLGALRNVEIFLAQSPAACTDGGAVLHRADFVIEESLPPNTEHSITITEICLAEAPLRELVETAEDVYESNRASESCS